MEYVKLSIGELNNLLEWAHHGIVSHKISMEMCGDDENALEDEKMVKEWDTYKSRAKWEDDEKYSKDTIIKLNRVSENNKPVATELLFDKGLLKDEYSISDGQVEYVNTLLEELFDILLRRNEMRECDNHVFMTLNVLDFKDAEEVYIHDDVSLKGVYQDYWAFETGRNGK